MLLIGVSVTLAGIAVIGYAGSLRSKNMTEEEKKAAVKDFALTKGLLVALLAGVMSAWIPFVFLCPQVLCSITGFSFVGLKLFIIKYIILIIYENVSQTTMLVNASINKLSFKHVKTL